MKDCSLVPVPQSWECREGSCLVLPSSPVIAPPEWQSEAGLLTGWIGAALGRGANPCGGPPEATGASASSGPSGCASVPAIKILRDDSIAPDEAYRLLIEPWGISLAARSGAGVLRGAASIRELLLSDGPRLQCSEIRDAPRFAWRGFMLDTARNFFSVGFIEKMIDAAAMHKLNVFHWHLTDDQAWRLALESAPEVAALGGRRRDRRYQWPVYAEGFYTHDDVARIVRFAADRHMTVVPEIESPGHATALLASHPEFSCRGGQDASLRFEPENRYGIFEDILCAGSDDVLAFMECLLDEVCSLFPGPVIHMGGDEAPKERWMACPRCTERMKSEKLLHADGKPALEQLQAWFMNRMAKALENRGRRMAGWDEVLEGNTVRSVLVMAWRGHAAGEMAARRGYDVVMCPQTKACYLDHKQRDIPEEPGQLGVCTLEDSYRFEPMPEGLSAEEASHILGGQGNLWTELVYFGRQAEYMLYPRLCALSEVFWSPRESRDYRDFLRRMAAHGPRLDALDLAWRRTMQE
ncbi:MAG: beta-N-acetylhexosaminidase [Spirochaetaceae bacterium]|nr:beta-N-acetylhexosaminidase [Spirochaetaceae bacterium]